MNKKIKLALGALAALAAYPMQALAEGQTPSTPGPGFVYVAIGCLVLLVILLAYRTWRRNKLKQEQENNKK